VAPAGSGKTVLLSQFRAAAGVPVADHLAETDDGDERTFLARLRRSFVGVARLRPAEWASVDDAVLALEAGIERRTLLVVDDFQVLQGAPAEHAFERVLERAPLLLTFLVASRSRPGFNLSRLRASGALIEIGSDELRFRSWEVERLFRDVYGEPLPPEALARLTRRTEGWAAALQLFHLATRRKPAAVRSRTLAGLGVRHDLVREYLARNVLDDLSDELRRFLLWTSVLGRLSGSLCDSLLGTCGSEELLRALERDQIFTQVLPDGGYRYHEILRAHLEAAFVESTSAHEAKAHYRRAAQLLEREGALGDALRAHCRAEAWSDVARLLGREGERVAGDGGRWLDALPSPVVEQDPWLLLAAARQERAAGRLPSASRRYQEAERLFPPGQARDDCLRERIALAAWIDPSARRSADAWGLLRQATVREPLAVRRRATATAGPAARIVAGLAALLTGQVRDATEILSAAADDGAVDPSLAAAARLGRAVALLLGGDSRGLAEAEQAAEDADRIGSAFLGRLARAAIAIAGGSTHVLEATASRVTSEIEGDEWGRLLAALFEGWGTLVDGNDACALLDDATRLARGMGAGVLEIWGRSMHALASARVGEIEAMYSALHAEVSARIAGVTGAQGLAYLALAETDPAVDDYHELVHAVEEECGLRLPTARAVRAELSEPAPLEVRCFGGFRLLREGAPIDMTAVRPRARRALRCLALFPGRPVHRETLIEALWPGGAADGATRHLHVLISTLRHVLEPGIGRGESSLIVRDGEAYRLDLPPGAYSDVAEFDRALSEGRSAQARGGREDAAAAFQRALDLYVGDLLPEDGPADWVWDERELRRAEACEAAHMLAELALIRGDLLSAAIACERGLHIDRHEDGLWRLCEKAYERAGNTAAAARTRRRYEDVLAELGLDAAPR
jgi:DNA-binding SARP family transcriptional activator